MTEEMTNRDRVYAWMLAESNKAEESDGWITRIYPRMKDELGLNDQQISKETGELVNEGKVLKEGTGVNTKWKAVSIEEVPVPAAEPVQPPPPEAEEMPAPEAPVRIPNDELIARIDRRTDQLREEIARLRQDREIIINAEPARERAAQLPPIEEVTEG